MSKYDNYYKSAYSDMDYDEQLHLSLELQQGENVLWQGKPKKSAKVFNSVFSAMLPFVLIWLAVDGAIIIGMLASGGMGEAGFFIVPFFALHLMPVWIWLGGIIKAVAGNKFNQYVITDRRILIKKESVLYNSIYFTEINNVNVKRSFGDTMAGTGDIYLVIGGVGSEGILDIADYEQVCMMIQNKLLELRQAGHIPQPHANYRDNVVYGNYHNSNMDVFTEGTQYDNTQFVVNGQFVGNPGEMNANNQVYNEYMNENSTGYNNQNY